MYYLTQKPPKDVSWFLLTYNVYVAHLNLK